MTCINLRETFGQRFRIEYDEAHRGRGDNPWLQQIPCRWGHIYPHGGDMLGVATNGRGRVAMNLARMPGVEVVQEGDDGLNLVFPARLFPKVAAFMKPHRLPTMSAAAREARDARLAQYHFQRQVG